MNKKGETINWEQEEIDISAERLIDEEIDKGSIIDNHLSLFPKQCQLPQDFEDYRLKKFIEFYKEFL